MNFKVVLHENFIRELKPLAKKFPSIKADIQKIVDEIEKELTLAADLGQGFKKIRLSIKSKGRGSSGGGRIITYETIVELAQTNVLFASIYNKTDHDTIDIDVLKKNLGL